MKAKQKFKIGQRVELSDTGKKHKFDLKSDFGVVSGFTLHPFGVMVQVQGEVKSKAFWMGFWK